MSYEVVPELQWRLGESPRYTEQLLTITFREWHRAFLLGIAIEELTIGGQKKTALEVERLNLWIQGSGAWRCSSLPYWEARKVLDDVLGGRAYQLQIGTAGGGRYAAGTQLEMIFANGFRTGQIVPSLEARKLGNH
jgi:hypothetical protein